jgi:predicted transposase YbfD/YdcC
VVAVGCHLLVQVKRNQRKLYESIQLYTALAKPFETCEYKDLAHGREVHRKVELFTNEAIMPQGWENVQRIVRVRRWGRRQGKEFEQIAYYILTKMVNSAQEVAEAIQQHWSIENNLHWVKDVLIGEDQMTLYTPEGVALLGYLNNIALPLLTMAEVKPNKDTLANLDNKVEKLAKVLINNIVK